MNHDDAFIQSIIENPDDDAPRLIYADWLDEHGQAEKAEFIRLQCQLARAGKDDVRRGEMEAREKALLEKHEKEWAGPLSELVKKSEFRRGFVEKITLAAEQFLTHTEAIFAAAPVRDAEFGSKWDDTVGTLSRLAASPSLVRLETIGLDFNDCLDDAALQALASLPALLQRLDELGAFLCPITATGLQSLVLSPHLARLGKLNLRYCMIRGEQTGRALAESPHLGRLNYLRIVDSALGDAAVQLLAHSENCRRLENLCLEDCDLGDAAAQALGQSPYLARLNLLWLNGGTIGDSGATALANSRNLEGVEYLSLHKNQIGDAGAQALAASPHLGQLRALRLTDNNISEAGEALLKDRFGEKVVCRS